MESEKIKIKRAPKKNLDNLNLEPKEKDLDVETNNILKNNFDKKMIRGLLHSKKIYLLIILVLVALCSYLFLQYRSVSKDPNLASKEKTAKIISEISNLVVIPNDPNAVLATVTDFTKLRDQHFFINAQNGDYIAIFPSVMKAVLYRPSLNKIVDIGPLQSTPDTASTTNTISKKIATTTKSSTSTFGATFKR